MSALPPLRPITLIAPRLDWAPAARAIQACAELLMPAGYYLAAGPWREAQARLGELRPAAALVIGPLDDPALRAALATLEIPIVETWIASAQPLDSAVVVDNAEAGRMAARHLAAKTPCTRRLRQRRHPLGTRPPRRLHQQRGRTWTGTGGGHRAARSAAHE
jgi:LacI family gluconate utilization system Gnt-I transcriptional repressor